MAKRDSSDGKYDSHGWSMDGYGNIKPPKEHEPGITRRHEKMMNQHDVRLLLFTKADDDILTTVSPDDLSELAYILAGTGGAVQGAPTRWAATWYGHGKKLSLAWSVQHPSQDRDFLLPWKMMMWQPTASIEPIVLTDEACGRRTEDARDEARKLHALASNHKDKPILDGAIPSALVNLLPLIGVSASECQPRLNAIIQAQLRAVMNVAKQRTLQVTHQWQRVGIPLEQIGSVRQPSLVDCQCCAQPRRCLFTIQRDQGSAEAEIIDGIISQQIDAIANNIGSRGGERAKSILTDAINDRGAHVCFMCAVPVVAQRHKANNTMQPASQPTSSSAAPTDPSLQATQTEQHTNSRWPSRTREKPVTYTPRDARKVKYAEKMQKSANDTQSKAAVTAELRAIGIQADESKMTLTRASARSIISLPNRLRGCAETLVGRIFKHEQTEYMVTDVAPSNTAGPDGINPHVVYALDLSKGITVNSSLQEACQEFDVQHVRRTLAATEQSGKDAPEPSQPEQPEENATDDRGTMSSNTDSNAQASRHAADARAFLESIRLPPTAPPLLQPPAHRLHPLWLRLVLPVSVTALQPTPP